MVGLLQLAATREQEIQIADYVMTQLATGELPALQTVQVAFLPSTYRSTTLASMAAVNQVTQHSITQYDALLPHYTPNTLAAVSCEVHHGESTIIECNATVITEATQFGNNTAAI